MKLKNRIVIFLMLFIASLCSISSLNSCLNDLDEFSRSGNGRVLRFELGGVKTLENDSYPTTYGPGGTNNNSGREVASKERETFLNTTDPVILVVFKHSTGEYVTSLKPIRRVNPSSSKESYNCVIGKSGVYDFLFVANADEQLKNILLDKNSLYGYTKEDVGQLIVKQSPGENNKAGLGGDNGYFLMTYLKEKVEIKNNKEIDLNKINLKRVVARLDIKSLIENFKIKQIRVDNRFLESRLYRFNELSMLDPSTGQQLKKGTKNYTSSEGLVSDKFSDCTGVIYGYENTNSDSDNIKIQIKASYQGIDLKSPYEFTLENLKIERNKLYSIVLTPKGSGDLLEDPSSGIKFNVQETDWDENSVTIDLPLDKNHKPTFKYIKLDDKVRAFPDENNSKKISISTLEERRFKLEVKSKAVQPVFEVLDSKFKKATDSHVTIQYQENESSYDFEGGRKDIYQVSLKKNESGKDKKYFINISNPLSGYVSHSIELVQSCV